jgi:4-hydroxyphenylacetate 3-monooxygenase
VIREAGGVITRLGDETIGEMWSLADGKNVLNEIDPRFTENVSGHIADPYASDPFHVSADTDPKGDRSKRPQEQDPDFLVHVVTETVVLADPALAEGVMPDEGQNEAPCS